MASSLTDKYKKWDKLELSDDEDDLHPNIDKDSWFRWKHQARVERYVSLVSYTLPPSASHPIP